MTNMDEGLWAVVPVKPLEACKLRLSPLLDPEQRQLLVLAMLRDVLSALRASPQIDAVLLISGDTRVRELAARCDARVLHERRANGYSEAVRTAARELMAQGVGSMLVLPADLPLIKAADIAALTKAHGKQVPAVTLSPDRRQSGTNALLCSPPDALPPCFGKGSFATHMRVARDLGLSATPVDRAALAMDVDLPEDLSELSARQNSSHTQDVLRSMRAGRRVTNGNGAARSRQGQPSGA